MEEKIKLYSFIETIKIKLYSFIETIRSEIYIVLLLYSKEQFLMGGVSNDPKVVRIEVL